MNSRLKSSTCTLLAPILMAFSLAASKSSAQSINQPSFDQSHAECDTYILIVTVAGGDGFYPLDPHPPLTFVGSQHTSVIFFSERNVLSYQPNYLLKQTTSYPSSISHATIEMKTSTSFVP